MRNHHWAIAACFHLVLIQGVAGQTPVEARVVDAGTNGPLPYASVVSGASGAGVITNEEGVFRISVPDGDSLSISYVGYRPQRLPVAEVRRTGEVRLVAAVAQLPAVEVVGAADSLYDLVLACGRNLRQAKRYHGKVLYELDTRTEAGPVEAIECFYNGRFNGGDIEGLELKQGRIGLLPDHGRYVANLNTSRGFMLLHPAEGNGAFPASPLQYRSRKALRKAYRLAVDASGEGRAYRIRFTPKDTGGAYFRGELWADAATRTVQGLLLECDHCLHHPFQPLGPGDALKDVQISYRQTYMAGQSRPMLNAIALQYALTYVSGPDAPIMAAREAGFQRERRLWSKGVLHLFGPGERFVPPLFQYDAEQTDYRKVLSMPYDTAFWAGAPTLVPTAQQRRDQALFAKDGLLLHGGQLQAPDGRAVTFFESNYAFWSPDKRVRLNPRDDGTTESQPHSGFAKVVADQIHLDVQLYLNMDSLPGGVRTFSATVFDGFRSTCRLGEEHHPVLLLNLYFDLCEMERRKMAGALAREGLTVDQAKAIQAEAVRSMDQATARFLRETHYGTDMKVMARWNSQVRDALGVDNFVLFGRAGNAK